MAQQQYFDLSISILNYNVKELLINCLDSVFKDKNSKNWQVIVVDNASSDGSVEAVRKAYPEVELIINKQNLGFAAGNNVGVKKTSAPVVLFLNPDTVIVDDAISKSLNFLLSNPDIGALTCRVELSDGRLDYSCHRGFPTPWNSFCYFLGFSKLFPKIKLFSGYTATYLDVKTTHEINCLTGAFLMVRKIAGEAINWWDETYFWNGEDIEFCYQLKRKGWKIFFYPEVKIIHFKGSSVAGEKSKAVSHGISAMRIFYLKHYYKKYPPVFRNLILLGIKSLEHYRKAKAWIYQ
jgi:GT2 family glycosyltransferase